MISTVKETIIKSKARVRDQGEVFTQDREVKNILALTQATDNIFWRFLEPACGNGNFLVEIVRQRLKRIKQTPTYRPSDKREFAIIKMLSTIYGVDIAEDNIAECKKRIMDEVVKFMPKKSSSAFLLAMKSILDTNIQLGDMLNAKEKVYFVEYTLSPTGYLSTCRIKRVVYSLISMENGHSEPIEELAFVGPHNMEPINLTKYNPEETGMYSAQTTLFNKESHSV